MRLINIIVVTSFSCWAWPLPISVSRFFQVIWFFRYSLFLIEQNRSRCYDCLNIFLSTMYDLPTNRWIRLYFLFRQLSQNQMLVGLAYHLMLLFTRISDFVHWIGKEILIDRRNYRLEHFSKFLCHHYKFSCIYLSRHSRITSLSISYFLSSCSQRQASQAVN